MLLVLGLLACGSARHHAALGWSLGGEAHVFIADDRFARDLYHQLTGKNLTDTLKGRPLVAVDARTGRSATVLSANGAAPARVTLARFHAATTCGDAGLVTELVLAFPPSGAGGRSTPPSHVSVVALLDEPPFAGGAGRAIRVLTNAEARALVRTVAQRAESAGRGAPLSLLHQLNVDADQAADAGEVVQAGPRYAVGFRATFVGAAGGDGRVDTTLITGVATADVDLRQLRWVVGPKRLRLHGGASDQGMRYSVRGSVAAPGGGALLLVDEISDASLRDSRATAVDTDKRRVVAALPLALRCP